MCLVRFCTSWTRASSLCRWCALKKMQFFWVCEAVWPSLTSHQPVSVRQGPSSEPHAHGRTALITCLLFTWEQRQAQWPLQSRLQASKANKVAALPREINSSIMISEKMILISWSVHLPTPAVSASIWVMHMNWTPRVPRQSRDGLLREREWPKRSRGPEAQVDAWSHPAEKTS